MIRAFALVVMLALGAVPCARANAPRVLPGQVPAEDAAPAFDGRVVVRLAPDEAAALRADAAHGLARMQSASAVLRTLSATYPVRSVSPLVEPRNLIPEARALGLDRWFTIDVEATGYASVAADLRSIPGVELVDQDRIAVHPAVVPNDSLFVKNWGHGNTATFPAYVQNVGHTGANVGTLNFDANVQGGWAAAAAYGNPSLVIAIIDTGVRPDHPDLLQVPGWDYVDNDAIPADVDGHGTACAGIAGGIANNTRGVVGSAGGCSIMPLRTYSFFGGTLTGLVNGVLFAAANGADVASMSFSIDRAQVLADALTAADAAGVLLFAATGNSNKSTIDFPASHPKVIAVGAAAPCVGRKRSSSNPALLNAGVSPDSLGVSCDNEPWWGSNWGVNAPNDSAAVDILGPTMLPTTDIDADGYLDFFSGTSCATPYVAGVAALIRARYPAWTNAQVRQRLLESALEIVDVQSGFGWDKYTGYGMVSAGLPDVLPGTIAGWAAPIVPRLSADATFGSAPAPTFLNGDVNCFVSRNVKNIGEAHSGAGQDALLLDGAQIGTGSYSLPANITGYFLNTQVLVRGGRHVLGMSVDNGGILIESDETNNRTARQWSWTPASIPTTVNSVVTRLAPPNRLGGRADVPVSETTYDNVDAVRMTGPTLGSSGQYWIMGLSANAAATDLDLGLHTPANSATAMFTTGTRVAASELGPGSTEWVLWNLQLNNIDAIDATSTAISGTGASVFESHLSNPAGAVFGGSNLNIPGVAFTAGMMVAVHSLLVQAGGDGPVTLELTSTAPLKMAIYDLGTSVSNRAGSAQTSVPHGSGQILNRTLPVGRHAIVVYRDRADGTAPLTYSITVRRTPAELVASTGGFLFAPSGVFKENVGDHTTAPTALDGNAPNTLFYLGYANTGPTTATGFTVRQQVDGSDFYSSVPGDLAAGAFTAWASYVQVRGGRHTAGFISDSGNVIPELDETNNSHASQWVWSPLLLDMEVPVTRPMPPDQTGGWAQVPQPATLYENVDGLTTPVLTPVSGDGFWNFFAATPRVAGDDVDLAVYQPVSTGPSNGFDVDSGVSALPAGRTEYIGIDVDGSYHAVDFGLLKTSGAGDVVVHGTRSLFLDQDTDMIGPYTLGPDKLVLAVEFRSSYAPRQIRLLNDSGNANLDLHFFERTANVLDPHFPDMAQTAEANGDGMDEVLQVQPTTLFPVVVVTKRGSADIGKTAGFRIYFGNSTIGTPDESLLPTAVRLAPVTPNPVREKAAIAFDLPRDAAVDLAAYDVAGRRVATLASGAWTAGRHAVNWALSASSGVQLASGVYLLKLEADGVKSVRRVVVTR